MLLGKTSFRIDGIAVEWSNWMVKSRMYLILQRCRLLSPLKMGTSRLFWCNFSCLFCQDRYILWYSKKLRRPQRKDSKKSISGILFLFVELTIIVSIDYVFYGVYCQNVDIFAEFRPAYEMFANWSCILLKQVPWTLCFNSFICSLLACHLRKKETNDLKNGKKQKEKKQKWKPKPKVMLGQIQFEQTKMRLATIQWNRKKRMASTLWVDANQHQAAVTQYEMVLSAILTKNLLSNRTA